MPIKKFRPYTPSRRNMQNATSEVTKKDPERSVLVAKKRSGGRNARGVITSRHIGGGAKPILRQIDFKRDKFGIPAKVLGIEYDPGRTANLALLQYADGEKRYIVAPLGLAVGQELMSGPGSPIKSGNSMPMKSIPTGTMIHAIEMNRGKGAQIVRSAGSSAQLLAREEDTVTVRLPSGEIRKFDGECVATIGQVGNIDHKNEKLGKAGRTRHRGRRPEVRGVAMTPRDHPHGGGEGRAGVGMPGPKSPWGKPTLGYKTRRKTKSRTMIVKGRK